jgi:iron(III) transport system permease protein
VVLPLIKPAVVTALVYSFCQGHDDGVGRDLPHFGAARDGDRVHHQSRDQWRLRIAIAYSTALIAMMMIAIGIIQLAVGERKLGRRATGGASPALLQTTPATGTRA